MSSLLPFQPSLAAATNTRLDTSCRHNQQCRVSTDDLLQYTPVPGDQDELQRHKYKYCVHKDEMVVGIGRPWKPDKARKRTNNAYPRVLSTMGSLPLVADGGQVAIKMITYMYHFTRSLRERRHIIGWFNDMANVGDGIITRPVQNVDGQDKVVPGGHHCFGMEEAEVAKSMLRILSDQIPVGFASTLGWSHPNTGDTMVTVNIGGLRTVMNGDFEVFTGDLIQW